MWSNDVRCSGCHVYLAVVDLPARFGELTEHMPQAHLTVGSHVGTKGCSVATKHSQLPCAWHVMTMPAHLPHPTLFASAKPIFKTGCANCQHVAKIRRHQMASSVVEFNNTVLQWLDQTCHGFTSILDCHTKLGGHLATQDQDTFLRESTVANKPYEPGNEAVNV